MKKLNFLFMLIVLSVISSQAAILNANSNGYQPHVVELEKWDKSSRSILPNPIECYMMDNYIEVRFIEHPQTPVTLQIIDAYGNIVYQNGEVKGQENIVEIQIDHLQQGFYEFYYFDEEMTLKGKFELE